MVDAVYPISDEVEIDLSLATKTYPEVYLLKQGISVGTVFSNGEQDMPKGNYFYSPTSNIISYYPNSVREIDTNPSIYKEKNPIISITSKGNGIIESTSSLVSFIKS